MSKVVVHRNAVDYTAYFHASLNVFELHKGRDGNLYRHTGMTGSSQCSQCIHAIVFSQQIPMQHSLGFTHETNGDSTIGRRTRLPTVGDSYPFYRRPASFRQNTLQA